MTENGTDSYNEELKVEETPKEEIKPLESETQEVTAEGEPIAQEDQKEEIQMTEDDCQRFYGVIMETGHSILSKKGHRELPEERRIQQGKLLFRICEKYNITIPTEFDVIILGAAAVADWQYMSRVEAETIDEPKVDIRESGGIRTDDTLAAIQQE